MLRDGDTVARLGGDEFAVLLPTVDGVSEAQTVAERLREALHQPFDVDGVVLDVEASVGIALSPWHGTDTEDLLRNADIAMYAAKELKGDAVVFEPEEHATAPNRLTVLGDLRRALEGDDELFLHFQPKFTLDGERIEGAEALLRWQHPTRGLIPPGDFIPVAEGTGIILRLTERVLGISLAQQRAWLDAGHAVPVAVNLSTRCLLDAGLPDLVQRLLAQHRVPARLLRLEVTESAVMGDAARCMEVLQRLHDLGVRLSIDDFGTGYSSMAYLRRLPGRRAEDRPLVRAGHVHQPAGRRPGAHRHRPRPQPGPHRRRRGRRGRGARRRAARPRLRHRAGLPLRPADARRPALRAARRGRHDPRRIVLRCPLPADPPRSDEAQVHADLGLVVSPASRSLR